MSRSARGGRRGGHRSNEHVVPPTASAAPTDARSVLEAVASNPALQGAHVILMSLVKQGIEGEKLAVRQCAVQALQHFYNGTGLSFNVLKGESPLQRATGALALGRLSSLLAQLSRAAAPGGSERALRGVGAARSAIGRTAAGDAPVARANSQLARTARRSHAAP
jgi:hypothetical protein